MGIATTRDWVMLARVAFLERHPEQFDASLHSAIHELSAENRDADEMEALAMQAEALLAQGKITEKARISRQSPTTLMLEERVLVQLQISSGSKGSSVEGLATALDEPEVFVRFALEQLRGHGSVFRRGRWWFRAGM